MVSAVTAIRLTQTQALLRPRVGVGSGLQAALTCTELPGDPVEIQVLVQLMC